MKYKFKRYKAMSTMGYIIMLIILAGIGMIISAPFVIDNSKNNNKDRNNQSYSNQNYYNQNSGSYNSDIVRRIDNLENQIRSMQNKPSQKYSCSMEGKLDSSGNVVSPDSNIESKKFVFVCEYYN